MSEDVAFWLSYITNGKHLTWYASFQFTIFAAIAGGTLAVVFGLVTLSGFGPAFGGVFRGRVGQRTAQGFRLDIPSGTSRRFEPGASRAVSAVAFKGARRVPGIAIKSTAGEL